MPNNSYEQAKALLQDANAVKALATTDKHGNPHIIIDNTITLDESGSIIYLELIETSKTHSNLVNSIWFNRKVAVYATKDDVSFQIKGTPARSVICGPVFEHYYRLVRERNPELDLSTVWVIEPEEFRNETYAYRKGQEVKHHPLLTHLDRLAK